MFFVPKITRPIFVLIINPTRKKQIKIKTRAKTAAPNSCIFEVSRIIFVIGLSLSTMNSYSQLNTNISITMGKTINVPPKRVVLKNDFIESNFISFVI